MKWLHNQKVNIYKIGDGRPNTYLIKRIVKNSDSTGIAIQANGSNELSCYTWETLNGYHIMTIKN